MVEIRIGAPLYAITVDQFRNMCETSGCRFVGTVQGEGDSRIWIVQATDAENIYFLGAATGVALAHFSMNALKAMDAESRFEKIKQP